MRLLTFCLWACLCSNLVLAQSFATAADESSVFNFVDTAVESFYTLGPGDKVGVTVFNHEDLSGEYTINGNGVISMPLIGSLRAKDMTISELERAIEERLQPDYLLNPVVNIQVMNYRPYYILGEVQEPGSYPYVDGMTFLNAVAIAGGFTEWAKKDQLIVVRGISGNQDEHKVPLDQLVMPGDIITVRD